MFLKDQPFLWYLMITPFSKLDYSVLHGILRATDASVVFNNIFNGIESVTYIRNADIGICIGVEIRISI